MKIKIKRSKRLIREVMVSPPEATTPEAEAALTATDDVRTAIMDELPERQLTVVQLNKILAILRGPPE